MKPPAIVIAGGWDPSGGAGLAVDYAAAHAVGAAPLALPTCIAAQNDQRFFGLSPVTAADRQRAFNDLLERNQIRTVKIGALGALDGWAEIFEQLARGRIPVVLDTVIRSSSGGNLVVASSARNVRRVILGELAPRAALITPNLPEADFLLGRRIADPVVLAKSLAERAGCAVLLKGGHSRAAELIDVLALPHQGVAIFSHPRQLTRVNIRGTGCALASAIAAFVARGLALPEAVSSAIVRLQNWLGDSRPKAPGFRQLF